MPRQSPSKAQARMAFGLTPWVQEFKGKIECITYYSHRVLLGTNDGQLVLFDMRRGEDIKASTTFPHQKKIEQIIAIPHIRHVLVLANGTITAHNPLDLQEIPSVFSSARSVRLMCLNERGAPHYRVCAVSKRKMMLFEYAGKKEDRKYVELREFPFQEKPESIAWYCNKIFLGFRHEYQLMNDKSGEKVSFARVAPDQERGCPLIKLLPNEEVLVSAMDNLGVLVNYGGNPLQKDPLKWNSAPVAVMYRAPYLIGLLPGVGIEIHSLKDSALVQVLPLPDVSSIFGNGLKFNLEPRSSSDTEDTLIVATSSIIYKVEPVSFAKQIEQLMEQGNVADAYDIHKLQLGTLPADKQKSEKRRFARKAGLTLLRHLEFLEAVEYLYKCQLDPKEWLAFFPDFHSRKFAHEPTILTADVLPRGDAKSADISVVITEGQRQGHRADTSARELRAEANASLLNFLENQLKSDSVKIDGRLYATIRDALFRIYVALDKTMELNKFVQDDTIADDIDLEDAKSLLCRYHKYTALGHLYATRRMFEQALDVYSRIGSGEYEEPGCDGVGPTVELLKTVPDESLVWEYSEWTLKRSPQQGLRILWDRSPPLQSQVVLDHLKRIDPALTAKYLERMVENDEDAGAGADKSHHTGLALEYLSEVVQLIKDGAKPSTSKPGLESGPLGSARKRLIKFLKSSGSHYDAAPILSEVKRVGLHYEFVILCGRSGRHAEALEEIVGKRKELAEAEEYCLKYGTPKGGNSSSKSQVNYALVDLLSILLNPTDESRKSVYRDHAYALLGRHGKQLNAMSVIDLLPDDVPVARLLDFCTQALPYSAYSARETKIARNLSNVYNLQVQCKQVEQRQQMVFVESSTLCAFCRKRLGDLVFVVYPNGNLVHYSCTNNRLDICPVTGQKFG